VIPSGGPVSKWTARCRRVVFPFAGCLVIRANESTGVHHVIADERPRGMPCIWLKLDNADSGDPISVGNLFAESYARITGSDVFGLGMPIGHTVARMQRLHGLLGPHLIVVSWGQFNVEATTQIRSLADSGCSVCIIVPESTSDSVLANWRPCRVIEADQFRLTTEEAVEIVGGLLPESDVPEMLARTGGRFVEFVSDVRDMAGLPPFLAPDPTGVLFAGGVADELPPDLLLSSLRRRGASVEAFEFCVYLAPGRAAELIREAAPQYVATGMVRRMLMKLEMLPRDVLEGSDDLMRWWFAALTSDNRHSSARPAVERVLASREAPELRAIYAAAFPGPDMVAETERAIGVLQTPVTLRMHGFALGQLSSGYAGLKYLMKALRLAEALGDADQVVAAATDIANFYLRRGHYRDGSEWARWAVDHFHSYGGRDELRRLAAVALLAYSRILTDDLVGVEALVEELRIADEMLGIPTSEGIGSTVADWCMVCGKPEEAEKHYRANLERLSRELYHIFALDLVPVLCALGRDAEAQAIGRRAKAITQAADEVTRALGVLVFALSTAGEPSDETECSLMDVCRVLGKGAEAHRLAQAAITLARVRLGRGDEAGASEALQTGEGGLRELGTMGWRLLSGGFAGLDALRALFLGDDVELQLDFLGAPSFSQGARSRSLTLRSAECLAAIAAKPEGLTLEQLSLCIYGEYGSLGTAKALVSRLRSTIPLTSRPYKIAVPFRADFLELLDHLRLGHVRQALNLYGGPMLPESEAPAIVELREHIDEALRQAVLASGDAEAMLELAKRTGAEDLELFETAERFMKKNDPQAPLLRARIRQIRRDWGSA